MENLKVLFFFPSNSANVIKNLLFLSHCKMHYLGQHMMYLCDEFSVKVILFVRDTYYVS